MQCNVGKVDKIVRVVLGVVIIGIGVVMESWLGLIGIIPLATAAIGYCPLYSIVGLNTQCKINS